MREEPDEAPWRKQQEWIKEMSPPTRFDYVASTVVMVVLYPIYIALTPVRWLIDRRRRDEDR